MAKKITGAEIVFRVSDDGTLKAVGASAEKTSKSMNKLGGASQTTDRRIKGVTQQSSNATKNFSKQAQTMQGGIVAVYATIAAQVFAVSAAFMFMKESFETRNLIEGQLAFGAATGIAYKSLTTQIQDATGGMIAFKEAAQAAAIGTAAGLTAEQLSRLGAVAKNTSLALGRDLTDAFNRLVRGTTKAEPELLDELGIILRLEPAMKKYAASLGKNAADLNQFEKSQAVANEVLEQGESKFAAISKAMDEDGFALARFLKAFDDVMIGVKEGVTNFLIPVVSFFGKNIYSLIAAMTVFLIPILRKIMPSMIDASRNFKLKAEAHKTALAGEIAALKAYEAQLLHTQQLGSKEIAGGDVGAQGARMGVEGSTASGYRRAVQHYDTQTLRLQDPEDKLKERTGKFKDSSEEMVRDMDKKLNIMTGKTKSWVLKGKVLFTKMGFNFNIVSTKMKMKWQSTMTFMTTAAAWMVAKVNMLMKGLFWLGILMMIIDLIKMLWNWLVPPDKVKAAQEEFLETTLDRYKTLNEEVAKMRDMQDLGAQNLSQTVLQLGNAFKSVDLQAVTKDFNQMLASNKLSKKEIQSGVDEIVKSVEGLRDLMGMEVKPLEAYYALLKKGEPITKAQLALDKEVALANKNKQEDWDDLKISAEAQRMVLEDGAESWQAFAENMQNAATATTQMAEAQKSLTQALQKGLGGVKKLPFQDVMQNLSSMKEFKDAASFGNEIGMATLERGVTDAQEGVGEAGEGVKKGGRTLGTRFLRGVGLSGWADEREGVNLSNANAELNEANALLSQAERQVTDAGDAIKDNAKVQENLVDWIERGNILQQEHKANIIAQLDLKKRVADIGFGSTAAQKNARLTLKDEAKQLKLNEANTAASQAQYAIDTMAASANAEDVKALKFAKEQADALVLTATAELTLQEKKTIQKQFENTLTEEKLALDRVLAQNATDRALSEADIALNMKKSLDAASDYLLELEKIKNMEETTVDLVSTESFWKGKIEEYHKQEAQDLPYLLTLENNLAIASGKRAQNEKAIVDALYEQSMLKVSRDAQRGPKDAELEYDQKFGRMNAGAGTYGWEGAIKGISPAQKIMSGYLKEAKVGTIAEFTSKAYNQQLTKLQEANTKLGDAKKTTAMMEAEASKFASEHTEHLKKSARAQADMNIKMELMEGVRSTIEGGFDKMFDALLDGTTSFGEAMKTMAADILKDLAKMYLKAAMMQALTAATGFPLGRYGGQFSGSGKSYAYGGVSTGPQSGHMAMLHGTEAIIPLGNDRSVPVQLSGSTANTVNVAVNVSGQNASVSTSGGGADAQALGRSIGGLVQQHLQQEMRPGGLLNRQGATGRGGGP